MKTSVMDVRDMLSVLSVAGVEERIGTVPGVESVTVNFAAGNATVRFDETRLDLVDIKSDVRQQASDAHAQPRAPTPVGHDSHMGSASRQVDAAGPTSPKTPTAPPPEGREGNASPAKTPSGKSDEPAKTA